MKSICFLLTKKRVIISSTAAADMKLIIVLYCSNAKTCKCFIPKTLRTCMWSNSWKIYSQNKPQTNSLTAPSHSLLARHQGKRPRHLHPKNQSREKAHEAYPDGKFHRSIFFPVFNSDNAISREPTMNEITALQPSAVVGNWLIDVCQILSCKNICILRKIVFAVINTAKFFLVK